MPYEDELKEYKVVIPGQLTCNSHLMRGKQRNLALAARVHPFVNGGFVSFRVVKLEPVLAGNCANIRQAHGEIDPNGTSVLA